MNIQSDVLATCRALFAPSQVVELRVLEIPGRNGFKYNAAGWFNDWQALADVANAYNAREPSGIYVTINPLHRACLARTNNRIEDRSKGASSDRDVILRTWLLIDVDSVRLSGISATTEELCATRNLMGEIAGWLEHEHGFPPGLKAHSGNGVHLLYRTDVPNDDASKELFRSILEVLASRFDNAAAYVDKSVFNAARILKLWGTVTRKGQHMPDRPHRQSKLWTQVDYRDVGVVPLNALERIAAMTRRPAAKKGAASRRSATVAATKGASDEREHWFDLDAWISRHAIPVSRTEPFDGTGTRYILDHCLFDSSHIRTSATLGRAPSGAIFYKCQHQSCADKGWKEVKALYKDKDAASGTGIEAEGDGSPWALAGEFIEQEYTADDLGRITLRRHRESFYAYDATTRAYRPMSNDRMRVSVTRWLGENGHNSTTRAVQNVMNCVSSLVTVPEDLEMPFRTVIDPETRCATADPQPRNWITLRNGILDLDAVLAGERIADCLMNHTAEWLSTTSLPFDFPTTPREATADRWLEFLNEVLEGDGERIRIIQEMFGYCFWRSTALEKFFILHGRGNNGKSTILEILQMLLGESNVSNLSLDQLTDPILRFELYHKMANLCGDLPEMERVEEGLIKRITSGERITCNRKYKDALSFRPTCKLAFATNPLPRFTDATLGVWRRMLIVPFEYVVPPEEVDIGLKKQLEGELPGILLWALEGAARLVQQQGFSSSVVCERANREYRATCFPVLTFLEECTEPAGRIHSKLLWQTYKDWCREWGLSKPKPLHSFIKDVINFYPSIQYPRVRTGQAGEITLGGIQLREGLHFGMDARQAPLPDWTR